MPAKPRSTKRLATARDPVIGGRETRYVLDITDLEHELMTTLRKIKRRDGVKVFKEGAAWLRDGLDAMIAA
jgi:hypothetical protein